MQIQITIILVDILILTWYRFQVPRQKLVMIISINFHKYKLPYRRKFSLGSYFRDFADCIRSRENKNRNNLFQQKFVILTMCDTE